MSDAPKPRWTAGNLRGGIFWLLLGDLLFIAADLLQRYHVLTDVRFLVSHERGYAELFQYAKAAIACLLLVGAPRRPPSAGRLTWAALLALVLLDDAMELHERAGEFVASRFVLPSIGALRANQVGELGFYAAIGVLCLVALAPAWRRGDPGGRALSRGLFPWFAALGFCAVVLDAVSSLTRRTSWATLTALLEDGGEMVALSFLTAAVWNLVVLAPPPSPRRSLLR